MLELRNVSYRVKDELGEKEFLKNESNSFDFISPFLSIFNNGSVVRGNKEAAVTRLIAFFFGSKVFNLEIFLFDTTQLHFIFI